MKVIKVKMKREDKLDIDKIIKNAQDLSMLSFELEEKREQSLISQSSQMLTAFSFISVALLMLVPILIDNLTIIPNGYILYCMGITLVGLLSSLVLALFVQWRYRYQSLPSPISIYSHIENNVNYFNTEAQRCKGWIETIEFTWQSKKRLNDKRVVLITLSMIVFLCSVGFILISTIFSYIFYILK